MWYAAFDMYLQGHVPAWPINPHMEENGSYYYRQLLWRTSTILTKASHWSLNACMDRQNENNRHHQSVTVLLASWSVAKLIHPLLGFETCQPDRLCHWSVVCTIKLVSMSVGMTPVEQVAGLTNSWNKSYASLVNSCFFNGARLVSIFKQYL